MEQATKSAEMNRKCDIKLCILRRKEGDETSSEMAILCSQKSITLRMNINLCINIGKIIANIMLKWDRLGWKLPFETQMKRDADKEHVLKAILGKV